MVAATDLAAKEYALGVSPRGGQVLEADEVEEAKLFIDQTRYDVSLLPAAVRAFGDSALVELRSLVERTAPPAQVRLLADSLRRRLAAAVAGGVVPGPLAPPSLASGNLIYREQCAACHGAAGRGDGPKAKSLVGPSPTNLADPAVMGSVAPVEVYRRIALGVPGTGMPQYEEALTEDERWAVTAYVMTLSQSPRASDEVVAAATVFAAVRRQVDSAVALRSDRIAFAAYLTFERVETGIRVRDPQLATGLEADFAELRARTPHATPAELAAVRSRLLGSLERAERLVTGRTSRPYLLTQSLVLLVREGFEAILIIAALLTFLTKAGAPERRREVALGAWAAVGASAVTAVLFELLIEITPRGREALEGITMLLAVVVLFYVSYWLFSRIAVDKWNLYLKGKMQAALSSGSALALTSVAFLAVYREGVETILFYKALLLSGGPGGAGPVAAGVALGAVVLVALYVAIMRLGVRVPMKPFFAITGVMLYYMAFVFAGKGIAELQEARILGTSVIRWLEWLRVPFLGIYPTVQSLTLQGVLLLLLVIALVVKIKSSGVSHQPSA